MNINTMPSDVSWFSSENAGAPQMLGQDNPNGLLEILDYCLVDGGAPKSVATATVSGRLVVLNFGGTHNFKELQVVSVSGADNPALNKKHKVVALTLNSISISVEGVTDVSGSLVVKLAPLGWESIFEKTPSNKRAYRSKTNKNKRVLFLDMSTPTPSPYHASATSKAKLAVVSVCEDMQVMGTQIGPMTDLINTTHDTSLFWIQKKSSYDEIVVTNNRTQWKLVGNGDFFFFIVAWSSVAAHDSGFYSNTYGFGEYADITGDQIDTTFLKAFAKTSYPQVGARYRSSQKDIGIIEGGKLKFVGLSPLGDSTYDSGAIGTSFPNPFGNSIFTMPLKIYDGDNIMGYMPSLLFIETKVRGVYNNSVIDDVVMFDTVIVGSSSSPIIGNTGTLAFYVGA